MKRRKLTAAEVESIEVAKNALRMVPDDIIDEDVVKVISLLREVERHRTSDGRPYVEPQPEIGEGYRLATEADMGRRDRDMFRGAWVPAHVGMHASNYTYRVPIDRIPTDEDAVGRPMVMVCDNTAGGWLPRALLHVSGNNSQPFLVISGDGFTTWKQARFPYPGELNKTKRPPAERVPTMSRVSPAASHSQAIPKGLER
jgi:hypothetical protein